MWAKCHTHQHTHTYVHTCICTCIHTTYFFKEWWQVCMEKLSVVCIFQGSLQALSLPWATHFFFFTLFLPWDPVFFCIKLESWYLGLRKGCGRKCRTMSHGRNLRFSLWFKIIKFKPSLFTHQLYKGNRRKTSVERDCELYQKGDNK